MITILSERNCKVKHHVSYDTILGMENEFLSHDMVSVKMLSKTVAMVNRICNKLIHLRMPDYTVGRARNQQFFFAAMGIGDLGNNAETLRYLIDLNNSVAIYCFDTWETQYAEWEKLFDYIQPTGIFLAYKQSFEYFKEQYSNVFWLPQSMDKVYFNDYGESKTRLFMQMGRKNEEIHKMILEYMNAHDVDNLSDNYVYERQKGKIIYPETIELALNMNRTKYFVCAPQLLENRKLTGNVADVTARYYEAMATKTLIIGYKPKAVFDELFLKNSMVDLENITLEEAIDYYENNPDVYREKVENNYNYVMQNHTWSNRLEQVFKALEEFI